MNETHPAVPKCCKKPLWISAAKDTLAIFKLREQKRQAKNTHKECSIPTNDAPITKSQTTHLCIQTTCHLIDLKAISIVWRNSQRAPMLN